MEEKKKIILEKAVELFFQYGIRSVSMDNISGELGISKKTLYQFFNDKQDLVRETMHYSIAGILDHFYEFESDTRNAIEKFLYHRRLLLEKMARSNNSIVFDLKKYYPSIYNDLRDFKRSRIYEAHLANLKQGVVEGLYRKEINAELLAKMVTAHQIYTFDPVNGVFTMEDYFKNDLLEQFITYHLNGICTPLGLEVLNRIRNYAQPDFIY